MKTFENHLVFFENKIENFDKINQAISEGSVGWHIAHCTLVIVSIVNAVKASDAETFKSKFNLKKSIIFLLKAMPRGKGKAPTRVMPIELITKDGLLKNIEKAKEKIVELNTFDSNNFFDHPYFGNLNLKDTIKFLAIHNNHHAKIIRDILK